MSDMNSLQKQREIQEQKFVQKEQEITQQTQSFQTTQQQQTTRQQSMDSLAVQKVVQANSYLQNERDDADAAEPDEAREELLKRQSTIGLGKRVGINGAHDAAGENA